MTKTRIFGLLMLFLGIGLLAQAAPITQDQARKEASSFLLKKQITNPDLKLAARSTKTLKAGSNQAAYYVYNVGNNQGFVIVSGDDRTNPILGYSDQGYFDEAKAPTNMKNLLDVYAQQIAQLDNVVNIKGAIAAAKNVVDTRNSIAPLLTTKWDQARPYWNKCPQVKNEDGEYEPSYTGCVATAMSQIMKYHNYPAQTTQVIPSYQYGYGTGNMGEYITQYLQR